MIKILKNLTKKEWGLTAVSLGLIVIQVWLDLTLPEYMGKITELVQTPGSEMKEILLAGGRMLLLALGSLAISIIIAGLAARITTNLASRLRTGLFQKVQSFTMQEINNFSIPSLITRTTNDITQVQMLVVIGLQILIKSPILAVWSIIKILDKGWQWSLATGIAVAALLVVSVVMIALAIPKFKLLQQQTDDLSRVSRENLTGLRVVRAYNAEGYQENKFAKANDAFTDTNLFSYRLMAALMPSVELIMNGLTLSVYWIGAVLISSAAVMERLSIFSDMMVFSSYAIQLLMAFMMLVMVLILIPRASVSANRICEVLETDPALRDGTINDLHTAEPGRVEFKHVSFRYPDAEDYVLQDISFQANKGETVAFIGATGCGKSTVVNLIPRFYDATEGGVYVDGINVKDFTQATLRNKIGYVSQKAILFKGDVSSNVSFGSNGTGSVSREAIVSAISTAQSRDFVEKMEDSYQSYIAPGGTNLSGGQKQRLSIARAIARDPEILIFDDSFSALDYKTDKLLRSELRRRAADATIIIVAQRIGTIKDADRIIVLDEGRIAGMGTHRELMKSCGLYKEIAYSQLSKEELENE
ncbi:ABC transporter ATP-binding protein [Murimonas intestini]|uniref:ATP-binding cassette subfamily B protein n=1 Tax=Murimonas intestini TaxID=1337051 RepID=A0AB73TAX8_9FIRM|nr:ABC transporter ATP-binding protein [Murimonas intestini]MCR1838973.1 ABC transporter ATP-binding protein/permease [Murimonas intestini]MCR1864269.1 ABC transporter ATP-binding protein/permease [Murimonas intestini]MCR1881879.1 ABC transporter ATP-binding protein/permease [Murimonas intestini]